MDAALAVFNGINTAAEAFARARDAAGPGARWCGEAGLVEHHHNGHLVMRGIFAGHYVDVDEALHTSESGAAHGWAAGALVGVLLGPAGIAAGSVAGAAIGSQVGEPSEADPEPRELAERLREAVPLGGSGVLILAEPKVVDAMLGSFEPEHAQARRATLNADQRAALEASLRVTAT